MLKIFNFVNSDREICPRPRKPAFSRMEDRFAASGRDPCGPFSEKPGLHAPPHASPTRTRNACNASRALAASHGMLLVPQRRTECLWRHDCNARSAPRDATIARSAIRGRAASRGVLLAPRAYRTECPLRRDHRTECFTRRRNARNTFRGMLTSEGVGVRVTRGTGWLRGIRVAMGLGCGQVFLPIIPQ